MGAGADRRGCPGSQDSRHPRRGGHPVTPQLSWTILVVSWPSAALRHRRSLPIGNGCCDEVQVGSLAGACREAVSMPPLRLRLPAPSPARTPGIGASNHHHGHSGERKLAKGVRWTAPIGGRRGARLTSPAAHASRPANRASSASRGGEGVLCPVTVLWQKLGSSYRTHAHVGRGSWSCVVGAEQSTPQIPISGNVIFVQSRTISRLSR